MIVLSKLINKEENSPSVYLLNNNDQVFELNLSEDVKKYVHEQLHSSNQVLVNQLGEVNVFCKRKDEAYHSLAQEKESWRVEGDKVQTLLNTEKKSSVNVFNLTHSKDAALAFCEGMLLGSYQFLKYLSDKNKKTNTLTQVYLDCGNVTDKEISDLNGLVESVYFTRDLVNEPVSFLDSVQLSLELKREAQKAGCDVTIYDKKKIEEIGFGGILAVNKGSVTPPTFSVIEWRPEGAKNEKPIVLVGKGVVYDTGGLSLKPTPNSMDVMKSDMGGAATVIGGIIAAAKANLPVHIIALVPSTDNRPGLEAYAPGDVITMHNKLTVEVLNTDAEGRMLLADALSFAQSLDPELVFDFATLTGSAVRALGYFATPFMGTASQGVINKVIEAGNESYERLVNFPFWDEYGEEMKSEIADLNNLGSPLAGVITAGKFLEHFTDYPWLHFDIAGPSFLPKKDAYRSKAGTGSGVRMLFEFFKNY